MGMFWEERWSLKWRARGSKDDQRRCGKHKWRRRARVLVWRKRKPWIEQDGEWDLERFWPKWYKPRSILDWWWFLINSVTIIIITAVTTIIKWWWVYILEKLDFFLPDIWYSNHPGLLVLPIFIKNNQLFSFTLQHKSFSKYNVFLCST